MEFDKVADLVAGHPHMSRDRGRTVYDHIVTHGLSNVLELGTYHGVSTCYLAAAVHELGRGHVVTMDRVSANSLEPNVFDLLALTGLTEVVTPVFADVSFTWELKRLLEAPTPPTFDFVFLDAGHMWDVTGFAFFLVDRLVRPGGWLLFDDLNWSVAASPSISQKEWARSLPSEQRESRQVEAVFDLLVARDPHYVTRRDGNWGWAQRVDSSQEPGPRGASAMEPPRSRRGRALRWRRAR